MDICPKCGLPQELCTCSELAKNEFAAKVDVVKRRYGKPVTIIRGLDFDGLGQDKIKELIKELKRKLACGGTFDKENKWIELQGSHKQEVERILVNNGYKVEGVNED